MDIQPQSTQPISDDQELAKVLAGISDDSNSVSAGTPAVGDVTPPVAAGDPPAAPEPVVEEPQPQPEPTPAQVFTPQPSLAPVDGELDGVKKQAITELRPLVDKLTLPPEEKFDTYLLLIRSTDDRSLIAPAHQAAQDITDETRRAQALLDIIKEIDFLSGQQPTT